MDYTDDKILGGRVQLFQPRKGYRVAIDPVLLAASVPAVQGQHVLDLGSGTGAVSFCLEARVGGLHIEGIEKNLDYLTLGQKSITANGWEALIRFIPGDMEDYIPSQNYDWVVANPPYCDEKSHSPSPDNGKNTAHTASSLMPWVVRASMALRPQGAFFLIFPHERANSLTEMLKKLFLEIHVFYLLPKANMPPNRVIFACRGQKRGEGQLFETGSLILHNDNGAYTSEAEAILRHAKSLKILPE